MEESVEQEPDTLDAESETIDRRVFLKQLGAATVYGAPVLTLLSAATDPALAGRRSCGDLGEGCCPPVPMPEPGLGAGLPPEPQPEPEPVPVPAGTCSDGLVCEASSNTCVEPTAQAPTLTGGGLVAAFLTVLGIGSLAFFRRRDHPAIPGISEDRDS